jgi:hypothetical protein
VAAVNRRTWQFTFGAIAVVCILGSVTVAAFLYADYAGHRIQICNVLARAVEVEDVDGVELTEEFLDRHPALAAALQNARRHPGELLGGGVGTTCDEAESTLAEIEALGAPLSPEGRHVVRHDGTEFEVVLSVAS